MWELNPRRPGHDRLGLVGPCPRAGRHLAACLARPGHRADPRRPRGGLLREALRLLPDGKPLDYEELERWTRVGSERGMRFRKGER